MASPWSLLLFISNIILVFTTQTQPSNAASTVSITAQPAFSSVRPCVQNCMFCGEYWLINCPGSAIGLNNVLSDNGLDSLYCRTDLTSTASSYLTSCIYSRCTTNTVDLEDGLSLYNGYCHIDGASLNNYPTLTSKASSPTTSLLTPNTETSTKVTTLGGQSSSASDISPTSSEPSPGNTPTVVVTSTETAPSEPSSTAQRSRDVSPKDNPGQNSASGNGGSDNTVTIVCSILGVILAFAALFAGRKWWKKTRHEDDE